MRDALEKALGSPIALQREFLIQPSGLTAGVLLSQLYYWSSRGRLEDGWIYKSQDELEKETGLSKREQLTARKKLEALGLVEASRKGRRAGSSMHYRVDRDRIFELCSSLGGASDSSIALYIVLVTLSGSLKAGIFLSQLYYWSSRGRLEGGWVYKSQDELQEETGLSKREQLTARKKLEAQGLIEAHRKGRRAGSPMHYRVNRDCILNGIRALANKSKDGQEQSVDRGTPSESACTELRQSTVYKLASPNMRSKLLPSIDTEITSKNTTTTTTEVTPRTTGDTYRRPIPPPGTPSPSIKGNALDWPKVLSAEMQKASVRVLSGLAHSDAQLLLDELEGRTRASQVRNPLGYLSRLVSRFRDGDFTPELAIQVQELRLQRLKNEAALAASEARALERLQVANGGGESAGKKPVADQVGARLAEMKKAIHRTNID